MHNIFLGFFFRRNVISFHVESYSFFFGVVVTQSARRDIIIRLSLSHVFLKLAPMLCVCSREKQSLYYYFFWEKQTVDDVPGRRVKQTTIFSAPSNSTTFA